MALLAGRGVNGAEIGGMRLADIMRRQHFDIRLGVGMMAGLNGLVVDLPECSSVCSFVKVGNTM